MIGTSSMTLLGVANVTCLHGVCTNDEFEYDVKKKKSLSFNRDRHFYVFNKVKHFTCTFNLSLLTHEGRSSWNLFISI